MTSLWRHLQPTYGRYDTLVAHMVYNLCPGMYWKFYVDSFTSLADIKKKSQDGLAMPPSPVFFVPILKLDAGLQVYVSHHLMTRP